MPIMQGVHHTVPNNASRYVQQHCIIEKYPGLAWHALQCASRELRHGRLDRSGVGGHDNLILSISSLLQLTPYHPIRNSWAELFDKEIFGNKGELFFSRSELFLLHCACKWKVTAS